MSIQGKPHFFTLLFFLLMSLTGFSQTLQPEDSVTRMAYDTTIMVRNHDGLDAPSSVTSSDWNLIGRTYEDQTFKLYYYKLLQVNASNSRYESIIELSVQGDANYYQMQGTYLIRVDKYDMTNRFDGLEIQCISGNPKAANFYVYNNGLWIRSNFKFEEIYYRTVADFSYYTPVSPLAGPTFQKTTTAPTGYIASTGDYGLKCDFDLNVFYPLPYTDVKGAIFTHSLKTNLLDGLRVNASDGNLSGYIPHIGEDGVIEMGRYMDFHYNYADSHVSDYDVRFQTMPDKALAIIGEGNVLIGKKSQTNSSYKLDVNGNIRANKVVVNTTGADYVFDSGYHLTSISQLNSYINLHHHLPDIASVKRMQANGLDLGNNQIQLLKKIEELTIYQINSDKKISPLQEELKTYKKELMLLKQKKEEQKRK